MNTVKNIIKMDMAIGKKSMLILMLSMLVVGTGCLFFFTPLLLGFFVVGSTAVVSAIFSVESKSDMEFFYGCLPIRRWEYVVARSLSCFLILAVPSVISIIFVQIGMHFSLCRFEEVRIVLELFDHQQMIILCGMIMLGFIGGANLLLVSFAGKLEYREMMEVLLLLFEALLLGLVMLIIQKVFYHGSNQKFINAFQQMITNHETISCILFIAIGFVFLIICTIASLKKSRK